MKKLIVLVAALLVASTTAALATPSTQIWIPSTDVQKYKTFHLGLDNYVMTEVEGPTVYDFGLTAGILPYEKIQMEIGADYIVYGLGTDESPYYFNAKVGTPEDSMFKGSPALAVGGYGFGTKTDETNQNILYAITAKTIPVVGRFSVGYFTANDNVIKDDSEGCLLSWDRTLTEISPKLWAGIGYQSGESALVALSAGVSWAFADNVSVIFGYDMYNDQSLSSTFTTQLDINF